MITAELIGRLGNMMFEIAAIEDMGYSMGIETCYPNVNANINDLRKPQACTSEYRGTEYFKLFKNFNWHKNQDKDSHCNSVEHVPFHFTPIVPKDFTKYIGYFQSELYFPHRDFILNLFEPADFIKEQLIKYNDIIGQNKAAIHVRRDDYMKMGKTYTSLDMNYYNAAIQYLRKFGITEYLVFSTDREWCSANFRGEQFTVIQDDTFVELFLMSKCAHNVIANSAFSWWGAYLNNSPNRQIIAPVRWFADNRKENIVPQNWMKI